MEQARKGTQFISFLRLLTKIPAFMKSFENQTGIAASALGMEDHFISRLIKNQTIDIQLIASKSIVHDIKKINLKSVKATIRALSIPMFPKI